MSKTTCMIMAAALMSTTSLVSAVSWAADKEEPRGIRAGSFLISPSIAVAETYDSNIFLEDSGETDTFLTSIAPELMIESNWNRHALRFEAGADLGFFTHDSDDNYIDYDATLTGVLDITRMARIRGNFGYLHDHEARGTVDVSNLLAEPVELDQFDAGLSAEVEFGRFRFEAFGKAADLDFEDAPLELGGSSNEDDRDRVTGQVGVEVGYGIREGYEVFVRGSYLMTDYDDAVDDFLLDRDSTGYRVLGGVKVDVTRLVEASFGVGYLSRDYDDPTLKSVDGVAADIGVRWSITPITTVFIDGNRSVSETTLIGASSATQTTGEVAVKHELLRNLTLRASGRVSDFDYEGINRNDVIYAGGLGAEYRLTRRLTLEPSYELLVRDSNLNGVDFTDHRASLSIKYGF